MKGEGWQGEKDGGKWVFFGRALDDYFTAELQLYNN